MELIFGDEFIFYTSSTYVWNLPTLSMAWFFFFHIEFWTMCHVSGQFESQSHCNNKTICSFDESRVMLQTFQVFPCSGNFLQWLRVTPSFVTTFPCLFPVCSLFYPLKDCSGCILYSFIAYFAGTFLFSRILDVVWSYL